MFESKWRNDIKEDHKTMVLRVGNCTVVLHRPTNLTKEERRRIEDQIRISMLGLAAEKENNEKEKSA